MCPAAGYAFFGGARGPRPTGRYVEPRVGDGVPDVNKIVAGNLKVVSEAHGTDTWYTVVPE